MMALRPPVSEPVPPPPLPRPPRVPRELRQVTASELTRDPDWPLSAWAAIRELKRQVNNLARLAAEQDAKISHLQARIEVLDASTTTLRTDVHQMSVWQNLAAAPIVGELAVDRYLGVDADHTPEPSSDPPPAKSSIICRLWTAIAGGRP